MSLSTITPLPTPPSRTDDSDTFNTRADALMGAFPTLVTEMNTVIGQIPAQVSPANFDTVSTTSVTIGTGSKSFTVETGKLLFVGQWVLVVSSASPTNYMAGYVTAYTSGSGALTVNVSYTGGSGTIAAWNIGPAPVPNANTNPRAVTAGTTTGTITPDSANADLYIVSGATGTLTFAAPSGTPVDGQKLMLRFKDNGTSRSVSWNAIYRVFGSIVLPLATTLGKWHVVGLIYNLADTKWDCIAHSIQA